MIPDNDLELEDMTWTSQALDDIKKEVKDMQDWLDKQIMYTIMRDF